MRGSAVFRTGVAPGGVLAGPWVRDSLWTRARAVPSLDLRFADNKSLVDATTGQNLVTFTRASSGTFVGSDGVLQSAVTNLLLRSEEFGTTWSAVATTVTSNTTTAPNGTLTADTLTDTNAAGDAFLRQSIVNPPNSATYTGSIYLKQGTTATTRVSLTFFDATTVNRDATVTWSSNTTNFGTLTNVGSGWYRLSFSETNNTSGNTSLLFTIRASGDVTGAETGTVLAWGAQLEQSTTVGEYIPTTSTINSAPRFDHNPETGESLGLLVEEQRSNLLLQSEDFGNVAYTVAAGSITTDTSTAPNGTTTADTVSSTGTTVVSQSYTKAASSITYTASLFVKGTVTALSLTVDDGATANRGRCVFNLSTGTLTSTSNDGTFTGTIGSITPFPNGWYRLVVTTTTNTTTTARHRFFWSGSGTSIDVWGAQLEVGAFPTSYIPTTTAAATRSADVCSITGSAFSGWANNSEGTIFSDSSIIASQIKTQAVWELSGGTVLSSLRQPRGTANQFRAVIGGTFTGSPGTGASLTTGVTLAAVAYSGTAGRLQVGSVGADVTGSALDATSLSIGGLAGSSQLNGRIKRLCFWPARLPDSTLQTITQ